MSIYRWLFIETFVLISYICCFRFQATKLSEDDLNVGVIPETILTKQKPPTKYI